MGKNEVILYLDRKTYMGGEVIKGGVEVRLSSDIKTKGVRVQLIGEEIAGWKSGTKGEATRESKPVSERRYHFKVERTLWGFQRSDPLAITRVLKAGVHRYDFDYELPLTIPCSFKHPHGRITYTVRGYAEKGPKAVIKSETQNVLCFGSPTAQILRQMRPITTEASTKAGGIRNKGTVLAQATLDQRVQFIGGTANIVLEGVNETTKTIDSATIELKQKLVFVARGRRLAPDPTTILKRDYKKLKITASSTYRKDFQFEVPKKKVTPSVFGATGLISAIYYFRIVLNIGKGLEVILPVTLISPYLSKVITSNRPQDNGVSAGSPPRPAAAGPSSPSSPAAATAPPTQQGVVDSVKCCHCGVSNPIHAMYCSNCAQILPAEVIPSFTPPLNICTSCQAENEPSGTACVVCGAALAAPAIPLTQATQLRATHLADISQDLAKLIPSFRFTL